MDVTTIVAIISVCIAVMTFFIGRLTASHSAGKAAGSLATDIKYIKSSIDRIERTMLTEVRRLEGRVEEMSHQVTTLGGEVVKVTEMAKSAHKRLDRMDGK